MNEPQLSIADLNVVGAEIVLGSVDLDADMSFFTEQLGFQIDSIFPADEPRVVTLSGYGLRVRLERDVETSPCTIRLQCDTPNAMPAVGATLVAPNGTKVMLVEHAPEVELPPVDQAFEVNRIDGDAQWGVGRAGMQYRDIIPGRAGGRFIGSHIRIPKGGPVPDYVHFHKVRFQMIYCYRGWVRLVYQDQGPPFVMQAGDCVLQPPEIRHRVLECGDGLEVIEIGCPAEHLTCVDHELALPTSVHRPDQDFHGQQFVRHRVDQAKWLPSRLSGFEARDLGIGQATHGLAGVSVIRRSDQSLTKRSTHQGEFLFQFVLEGETTLSADAHDALRLAAGDSFVVPAGVGYQLEDCSERLELLEVRLPA